MDTNNASAASSHIRPSAGCHSHAQAGISNSLPSPDPSLDEGTTDWCTLHSLASLGLTLDCIIHDCMIPKSVVLLITDSKLREMIVSCFSAVNRHSLSFH